MTKNDRDLLRNGSGYVDPTAYKAIKNSERIECRTWRKSDEGLSEGYGRAKKLRKTILYICDMAGFEVEGSIILRDKKTRKVWR